MGSVVQTSSMITPKFNHESFKNNNSATKSSMQRKAQETGTHSKSSSFSKLPQVANLPKSERVAIDNKRSNSVAISQLKFAQSKKSEGQDMTKLKHKRNKVQVRTTLPEQGRDRLDSRSKSFVYSELDDSIERRRKKHMRNEAQQLSKKYASSGNTRYQVSSIALKNYFMGGQTSNELPFGGKKVDQSPLKYNNDI